ncbi:MAG: hypothetical protein ACREC6_08325 [Hyphomicrobiaceae bacterium]
MTQATGVAATVLSPFYYHSLAVPSGTATLPVFMPDRAMSFALSAALGALRASPALPLVPDYRGHLAALPWMTSVFETEDPALLRPLAKRLNIDAEGGLQKKVMDATGTGNLKTYFFVQEVALGVVYRGAVFGPDPFATVERREGRRPREIVVRTGRHLAGLLRLERADVKAVRLNVHTAALFEQESDLRVEIYALHDLQVTPRMPLDEARDRVGRWRSFEGAAA